MSKPLDITRVCFLLLLLTEAVTIIIFLVFVIAHISFPYPLDFGEGVLLDQSLRLSKGENIYTLAMPPYTISNYPPVFPLIQVPFAWIFGPWPVVRANDFYPQRNRHGWLPVPDAANADTGRRASLIGALTFLAIPFVVKWSPLNR